MTITPGPEPAAKSSAGKWLLIAGIGCAGVLAVGGCILAGILGVFVGHSESTRVEPVEVASPPARVAGESDSTERSTPAPDRSELNAETQGSK